MWFWTEKRPACPSLNGYGSVSSMHILVIEDAVPTSREDYSWGDKI